MPTTQLQEIYKALFCQLYFLELKTFLCDFDITPTGRNSLNMRCLTSAYDHNRNEDLRDKCKWKLGEIKDSDLMLAIEEYFEITNHDFNGEKICNERNKILSYLFENEKGDQIRLGDHTLYAILDYFGMVPMIDKSHPEMRGIVREFRKRLQGDLPEKFRDYWYALDLHACLRNWQGHSYNPRFYGLELHLYHRYVLYTYIGLVYYCRQLWLDSYCKTVLIGKMLSEPACIAAFKMPNQIIHVKITSPDNEIIKCVIAIGPKKGGTRISVPLSSPPTQEQEIDINAKKYQSFNLVVTRRGYIKPDSIPITLNYQSWFLTFNILLPKKLGCNYAGGSSTDNYSALFEMLAKLQGREDKLTRIIQDEFEKIKDLWIASVTRKDAKDRDDYNSSIKKLLEDYNKSLSKEECAIERFEKEIQTASVEISKKLDEIRDFYVEFDSFIEKELSKVSSYLSWLAPLACLIISGFGLLLTVLYPLKASLLWLQTGTCIIIIFLAFILIAITVFSFTFFNSGKGMINKLRRIGKWQWACLAAIIIFMATAYWILPYKRQKDLINQYVFVNNSDNDTTETIISIMKNYLKENPKDEQTMVKLATYYIKYTGEVDSALHILDPMTEDYSKYTNGAITIAEAFYAKKNYNKVWNIFDGNKIVFNDSIPAVARLKGVMYAYGQGKERDFFKGINLLDLAIEKGDLDAMYWAGCLESSPEMQIVDETSKGDYFYYSYSGRFNLLHAIHLLRRASNLPNASIELGNIYADLNMVDSAKYYYQNAINLSQSKNLEAIFQLGKLLYEKGDSTNSYMAKALMRNYPPAILFNALRTNDHIAAIEQYKLFNDSAKSANYHLKYKEDYRYINPIVFEYISANKPGVYNGLDSAYNYLVSSHPNGKFNMEFVKGIEAMTDKDSLNKNKAWSWIQKSADKGCLYADMMCNFRVLRDIALNKSINSSSSKYLKRLGEIGDEIPFSNVLLAWIYRYYAHQHDDNFFYSDFYIRKALKRNHIAACLVLTINTQLYLNLINDLTLNVNLLSDSIPESIYKKIGKDSLKLVKSYYATAQIGLRFAPTSANKMGFITIGFDLDKMLLHYLNPEKNYPDENLHFWCDLAISNHDFLNECNMINEYLCNSFLIMRNKGEKTFRNYISNEPYVKRLIIAGLEDIITPIPKQYEDLLSVIISWMDNNFYDSLLIRYANDPYRLKIISNTKANSHYKARSHFAGWHLFSPDKDEDQLLKECYSCFSPYYERTLRDSINTLFQQDFIE